MIYLTEAQLLFIHARLLVETGGSPGVLELNLLRSAVGRPQATFDGQELSPDLFTKASALMDSVVRNHPFIDGNKRVGITAAGLFLLLNGRRLTASQAALEEFTLLVAQSERSIQQMTSWFQQFSKEIESPP